MMEATSSDQAKFFISNGNADFNNRQKDIFAGLNHLEDEHTQFQKKLAKNDTDAAEKDENDTDVAEKDENDTDVAEKDENYTDVAEKDKHENDTCANFKRPSSTKRIQVKSRFVRDPRKWTKYSLADVKNDEMTDSANTSAAMEFLQQCHKRKLAADTECRVTEKLDRSTCSSTKWVMPEYVVGKYEKRTATSRNIELPEKVICLSHLEDDETLDVSSDEQKNVAPKNRLRNYRKYSEDDISNDEQ